MIPTHLLLQLFCIFVCFVESTVAREVILGANKARPNQFPYQVALTFHGSDECGGGIIGDEFIFILTAAHCVLDENKQFYGGLAAVVGTNDLDKINKVTVPVKKIFVGTWYNPETWYGDIAVLKLNHSLRLSRHCQHLARLKLPLNENEMYNGKTVKVAGFGWTWYNKTAKTGGNSDHRLRYADVDIVNRKQCAQEYGLDQMLSYVFCARVKQHNDSIPRGICNGDSGSPLVYRRTVIGLIASGPHDCEEMNLPALYTPIGHFLPFIKRVMQGDTRLIRIHEF